MDYTANLYKSPKLVSYQATTIYMDINHVASSSLSMI